MTKFCENTLASAGVDQSRRVLKYFLTLKHELANCPVNWEAFFCLGVPSYSNQNCMNFTGQGIDKFMQIGNLAICNGKDVDIADTGWLISSWSRSSLEMFNELQSPFLEFTFHNISFSVWYGCGSGP